MGMILARKMARSALGLSRHRVLILHYIRVHTQMLAGAAASAAAATAAAAVGKRPALSLLRLGRSVGIREQLWLEEALLRHDARNWCVRPSVRPWLNPLIF